MDPSSGRGEEGNSRKKGGTDPRENRLCSRLMATTRALLLYSSNLNKPGGREERGRERVESRAAATPLAPSFLFEHHAVSFPSPPSSSLVFSPAAR